jgi:hypothetical protein
MHFIRSQLKAADKHGMFRTGETLLQHLQNGGSIGANKSSRIKPRPRKNLALIETSRAERQWRKNSLPQDKQVNGLFEHAPDDLFPHFIAAAEGQFGVQFNAHFVFRFPSTASSTSSGDSRTKTRSGRNNHFTVPLPSTRNVVGALVSLPSCAAPG